MTYEEYKSIITKLNEMLDVASNNLKSFPRGEMGLTPDHIKKSEEYISSKYEYDRVFSMVRKVNGSVSNEYKRKLRSDRGR